MTDDLADLAGLFQGPQSSTEAARAARGRGGRAALLIIAIILVLALGSAGGYVWWALNAPLPAPTSSSHTPDPPTTPAAVIAVPTEVAASALSLSGAEEYLGKTPGIWAESGTNDPRPMASISKLITALVVLERKPLANATDPGPTIRFSKADHDLYDQYYVKGATIAAMPTGSSMSEHDAIAMMLVPSASNYADAVSTWAFGSRGAFLSAARKWLAKNGLNSTGIVEPTGISPQNTSTPSDLIALGRLAAAHPAIAAIATQTSIEIPSIGGFSNTNNLLGVEGVTGLKTGNLGTGSHNLLYTASMNVGIGEPLQVVGVVLGGATGGAVDDNVRTLLASIREGFDQVEVASSGQVVGHLETAWGDEARMVIPSSASLLTWSDTPIEVSMKIETPKTFADGEVVGSITWTAGPNTTTSDIRLEGTIGQPDEWWRLTHPRLLGAE
ncbi:D-alanyl-D-alanine carboxypeptidase [Microbacterium sp. KUDC0406]|uniref:D-alanyl-D-alanine carboxypeptidase family protein n=1 Tax=Microbacterium sp. KUDC0406 TaxID=2909588 RepID=UPI001F445202|nr:D-alanyl-D-alanine carboxypeptidase [Microbacterium sp. KUDC0406]UJP10162.1 D-alanyl-D-alanine carboxypeptidase [Microbacterium sp. KUDC0406]